MKFITHSTEETYTLARDIAQKVLAGELPHLILLTGELGGGKTTFSQGFSQGLGISQLINSPTFVIMKSYPIPKSEYMLYHLDIYRLSQEWEVNDLDISDILSNPRAIILVEWADKFPQIWTHYPHITIHFEGMSPDTRTITIQN
jgi:tRNA threonylcarbamoyladenosine biosynthesis protein TsaE